MLSRSRRTARYLVSPPSTPSREINMTAADALNRAEIQIFNNGPKEASPLLVTGLADRRSVELPAGEALIVAAGTETTSSSIYKIKPLPPDIRTALALSIATELAPGEVLDLSGEIADIPSGNPVVVHGIGRELDLSAFTKVAEEAVENDSSLVILTRTDQDE